MKLSVGICDGRFECMRVIHKEEEDEDEDSIGDSSTYFNTGFDSNHAEPCAALELS
jgi:hypothetical protein